MKKTAGLVLSVFFLFSSRNALALCAMCRQALEESGSNVIQGFYWSIILLCGIPMIIFAAAAIVYVRLQKKARAFKV